MKLSKILELFKEESCKNKIEYELIKTKCPDNTYFWDFVIYYYTNLWSIEHKQPNELDIVIGNDKKVMGIEFESEGDRVSITPAWRGEDREFNYEELKEQYEKIYNENCKLREEHNISDISLLDENAELKKQLENWKHQLESSKEILNIQGQNGNYNYDNYMLGLYNGMEAVIALFEKREPNYKKNINLLHNDCEIQQQEFIKYLEEEKDRCLTFYCRTECAYAYDTFKEVLKKYKEIIGGNKDE